MRRVSLLVIILMLIGAAVSAQQLPPVNPANAQGDIDIAGTISLESMTNTIAQRFRLDGYVGGNLTVTPATSADAIQLFCSGGTIDIIMVNRQMTPQEINACTGLGISPVAFRVATQSISVVTSPVNDFLTNADSQELQRIFGETLSWDGIQPTYPSQPILRYGTSPNSPEYQLFAQVVYGGNTNPLATSVGAQYVADDNTLLQGILSAPNTVGFVDTNFALANPNSLKTLTINNVLPTAENIANGTYVLARPLYLYTSASIVQGQPQVGDFLNYYLVNAALEAQAAGLYPPTATTQQTNANTWFTISGGSAPVVAPPTIVVPPTVAVSQITPAAATPIPEVGVEQPDVVITNPDEVIVDPDTPPFADDVSLILVAARTDMEVLVTEMMGSERPLGWNDSLNVADPGLLVNSRLNLELLAASEYGEDQRPSSWIGALTTTQKAASHDLRHDLEALANTVYGGPARPQSWNGDNPIYNCDRATRDLVILMEEYTDYVNAVPANTVNYCPQARREVTLFVEINLLQDPVAVQQASGNAPVDGGTVESEFAVAFYNSSAATRAGLVPVGESFRAVARSYVRFSNMVLIEGNGFLVFVDYTGTTLTQDDFEALDDIANIENLNEETYCTANWCD